MTSNPPVADLPDTLEYTGEFGVELIAFIPFIHWLQANGQLGHRRILTYAGMRPFYYFLRDGQYSEKAGPRHDFSFPQRPSYWPTRAILRSTETKPSELYPDYRKAFGGRFAHRFGKPPLVIQNKFCDEWERGPINFMTLETLDRLFNRFKTKFQIVYFRDGFGLLKLDGLGFSRDHNHPLEFDDEALLQRHPEVISFERMVATEHGRFSYNELKLMVFADCHDFIASQGGGNYLAAVLSDTTMVILHRVGPELRVGTYARGFYRYLAGANSRLLVARSSAELEDAAGIFLAGERNAAETEGPDAARLRQRYSSDRAFDPDHVSLTPLVW
jgi:hypothetical protein